MSLASCVSTLNDLTLINVNPVSLVRLKKFSAGLQYENTVGLSELQKTGLIIAKPFKIGGVGLGFQSFGCNSYRVINSGVDYGFKLTDDFFLGVHLGLKNISIQSYGSRTITQLSLAFQGKISNKTTYGLTVQSIGKEYKEINGLNSLLVCMGVKYKPSEVLHFYSEIEKTLTSPVRVKIAFEYQALKSFYFRTGIITSNRQICGGFGCVIKEKFRFDFGSTWQSVIGVSIQGGILFLVNESD